MKNKDKQLANYFRPLKKRVSEFWEKVWVRAGGN